MQSEHRELLDRIEAFSIDAGPVALPFAERLAKENGWSRTFSARAIREYRRFVFLAMTTGRPMSPSDAVDQVWHLHLTYTRSYWDRFCGEVLRRPLHHLPTEGGPHEVAKFHAWYADTLESYAAAFGEPPPEDIWPSPAMRAETHEEYARIDRRRHWIIPRKFVRQFAIYSLPVLALCIAGGCAGKLDPFDLKGHEFLGLFVGIFTIGVIAAMLIRRAYRTLEPETEDPTIAADLERDVALAGCLGFGDRLATHAALAGLLGRKILEIERTKTGGNWLGFGIETKYRVKVKSPLPSDATPLEQQIYQSIASDPAGIPVDNVHDAASPSLAANRERLEAAGYLMRDEHASPSRFLPAAIIALVVLIGWIKIGVGVWREKPVGYLVLGCVAAVIVAIAFGTATKRTVRGDQALADLRKRHKRLKVATTGCKIDSPELGLAVGLYGFSAIHGASYFMIPEALAAPKIQGGGGACGSNASSGGGGGGCGGGGCGGGGCGGGCGGCGG